MGFFNRKSGKAPPNDINSNGTRSSKSSLRSPPRASNGTGSTFTSPSLPDITLPPAPDPKVDPAAYLRSIYAVRERSKHVLVKAKRNQLAHFTVDMSKFNDTATYVVSIINVSVKDSSPFSALLLTAFVSREISNTTIRPYLLMADGSILKPEGDREWSSCWQLGLRQSTTRKELDGSSISFSFLSF